MCGIIGYVGSGSRFRSSWTVCGGWNIAATIRRAWLSSTTAGNWRCAAPPANCATWRRPSA